MDLSATNMLQFGTAIVTGVGALVSTMVVWLTVNRERVNKSRYDEREQVASLSMMRAAYEERLADLTDRLTATQERWSEVNHLLLDAQQSQYRAGKADDKGVGARTNSFLTSLGIDPSEIEVDPKYVFVLTPFADREKEVYDAIRNTCHHLGLRAGRGDEEFVDGPILPHIVREILRAKMVIGNISSRNPNVFYELGVAQALGKPTVLVSRAKVTSLPFDLRNRRVLFFEGERDLEQGLVVELARWMVDAPYDNAFKQGS